METESQFSIDAEGHPEPLRNEIGDLTFSSSMSPQPPVKKATRQWAAWTHQEEENFFTALRQVGKNFDKITCRVQSKNKDQVRHYYYRLVRRMNKLLGPGLCLDAKNSKDTNAAMLRWWSLLEKYSCKASKLHLKPRRFKIFIEALELQLLKDQKKNVKKRILQGDNYPPIAPGTLSNQSRALGNDVRSVKLVLVDSQNIRKLAPTKAPLKHNANMGVCRNNNKGEATTVKSLRHRRKTGTTSAAADRKWEKVATDGVSLVADAAEHLERAASSQEIYNKQIPPADECCKSISGKKCSTDGQNDLPSLPTFPNIHCLVDSNGPNPGKLKLQLFPIDDRTRRALEMDEHNPYLELTLSSKKRISSVLDHLNKKWGNSSIAVGELMLFPYNMQNKNTVSYQRWTQDSILSAADVYTILGSPQVFRLRYGWFSDFGVGLTRMQVHLASGYTLDESYNSNTNINRANKNDQVTASVPASVSSTNDMAVAFHNDHAACLTQDNTEAPTPAPSVIDDNVYSSSAINNRKFSDLDTNVSWNGDDGSYIEMTQQFEDMDDLREIALSPCEWADSLTNISVADLLSEVAHDIVDECKDALVAENSHCMEQGPFCSDSFDAAIAAHISCRQDKTFPKPTLASNLTSIWDEEETCDAFSFNKYHVINEDATGFPAFASIQSSEQLPRSSHGCSGNEAEHLPEVGVEANNEFLPDHSVLNNASKDFYDLNDMYWPDSLGTLDLDIPYSKYHSEDMILSDSLSGLNRFIASSLDAYQSFSLVGWDKKEASSTLETREIVTFSDVKVSSEV